MRSPPLVPPLLVALAACLALAACRTDPGPPLIEVTAISPREVEEGERVTLRGTGFPEGKTAHVTFRGDMYRPGEPPLPGVEVDVDGVAKSATTVEIPFDTALQARFAGEGEQAAHTTFTGDLTVAFAASRPAAPPVVGNLRGFWIDVSPPTRRSAAADSETERGRTTLTVAGIEPAPNPAPGGEHGVAIAAVAPGSSAEAARLLPGDVITEFAGVRVLSLRDIAPPAGARTAWLRIRRGEDPQEQGASLRLAGPSVRSGVALQHQILALGLGALLFVVLFGRVPALVGRIDRTIAQRLRTDRRAPPVGVSRGARSRGAWLDSPCGPFLACAGATALLALLPLVRGLGVGQVDVGVLWVVSHTALLALALTAEGVGSTRSWSPRRAWRACARTVSLCVTAGAALALAVVNHGSLGLEDLVRGQGPWPWRWTALQSPPALCLALLWLATVAGCRWDAWDTALQTNGTKSTPRGTESFTPRRWRALVGWVYGLTMCGLATAVYLGGWQLARLDAPDPGWGWQLAGTALFVSKTWGLFFGLVTLRRTAVTVASQEVLAKVVWWRLPLSLSLLAAALGWSAWPLGAVATRALGTAAALLAGAFGLHVVANFRAWRRDPLTHVDPFI